MDASQQIDRLIADTGGWRGEMLAAIRETILAADPEIIEEWKWMGTPTWSRGGLIAVANPHKGKVKLTFADGAKLPDARGLFNAGLEGNLRRAIDFFEGDRLDRPALTALVREAIAYNLRKKNQKKK